MNYLISVTGTSGELSKELLNLSVLDNSDGSIFKTITHPDGIQTAMVVDDLDYEILVHPNKDLTNIKSLLTNPPYDPTVVAQLEAYIDSIVVPQQPPEPPSGYVLGRFPFRNVVEGYVPIYNDQYMIDNGWEI